MLDDLVVFPILQGKYDLALTQPLTADGTFLFSFVMSPLYIPVVKVRGVQFLTQGYTAGRWDERAGTQAAL